MSNQKPLGPYPRQQHLISVGRILFGSHWESGMASMLSISRHTIIAWVTGAERMPAEAVWPLNRLARRHGRLLAAQCDFIEKIESELHLAGTIGQALERFAALGRRRTLHDDPDAHAATWMAPICHRARMVRSCPRCQISTISSRVKRRP